MTLRQKQSLFVKLLTKLFLFVESKGWEVTLGEGYNSTKTVHMPGSLHFIRLAQDINLFVDGKFITDSFHPAYKEIGQYWKSLDPLCAWGGDFDDGNHFSLMHGGKK